MQQRFSGFGLLGFTLITLAAVGCGDKETKKPVDQDAGAGDAAMPEEVDPNGPWAKIYDDVIVPNGCDNTFCHGHAGELNLSLDLGYENLVGVKAMGDKCKGKTTKMRVMPGEPDKSLLIEKLGAPTCGDRMPVAPLPKITAAQMKLLRQWISDGAPKN